MALEHGRTTACFCPAARPSVVPSVRAFCPSMDALTDGCMHAGMHACVYLSVWLCPPVWQMEPAGGRLQWDFCFVLKT